MTHTEIVNKLIGTVMPSGDSSRDDERFENLKAMCELVNNLITQIDDVSYRNRESHEFSVKRSADFAKDFLTNSVGIKE